MLEDDEKQLTKEVKNRVEDDNTDYWSTLIEDYRIKKLRIDKKNITLEKEISDIEEKFKT